MSSNLPNMFMQSAITAITSIFVRKVISHASKPELPAPVNRKNLPAPISRAQQNPELLRQEMILLKRREDREDTRLKADMQIAARQLELDAQRIEVSKLYLKAVQQQTCQELQLRKKELQAEYDKNTWGSLFSRREIENIFNQQSQQHRLLMLVPEPKMASRLPEDFRDNLHSGLRNKLKRFVEKYYPLYDSLCPVEFYGRFFDRDVFDAELKKLENVLTVPTAIIFTDINNREVFFNLKLTGLERPIELGCDTWNWRDTWRKLQQQGMDEEDSLEQIETILIQAHQTLAAFLADLYYLNINPHHIPRLFDEDLQRELPAEWVQPCLVELLRVREEYLRRLLADQEKGTVFAFETVTVNRQGSIIQREQKNAHEKIIDLGQGVSLSLVYIPAGEFMMGAQPGEENARDNEYPRHKVTIARPYYLGKTPVTQAQWQAVMGNNLSHFKGANRPVEMVNWHEATEFCKKLSDRTGGEYRLPSEAEWEYACRAGTETPFCFGPTMTSDIVNFDGNYSYADAPKSRYREETTPVARFPPNAFGLYDMHGNVWEWCQDVCHGDYNGAPTDGSAWVSDGNQDLRLLRGGSWYNSSVGCRSAYRGYNVATDCLNSWSFRLCARI